MRKKVLLLVLVGTMTIALLLSGCVKSPIEKGIDELIEDLEQTAQDVQDVDEYDGQESQDIDNTNDGGNAQSGGQTPGEAYGRFMNAKGIGYDSLSSRMDDNIDLSMTAGLELLAMTMIDLEALALTLVTQDLAASEMAGDMLGMQNLKIKNSGENFSLAYEGMQGEAYAAQGKYDGKTDSLTCIWTKDGVETLTMEFVKYNNGYAGQYFITNEEGKSSVIKVIIDGEDIAVGMGDVDSKPSSIYKSAPGGFSFVEGCTSMFVIQGGQGVSTMDGVVTSF